MKEERQRIYTVLAVVSLASLLFSCVAGAIAGGAAGYLVGKQQAVQAADRALEEEHSDLRGFPEGLPWYWEYEHPFHLPDPHGEMPVPPPEMIPGEVEGALILEVIAGTPADEAGLEPGDVIIAIDSTPIDRFHALPDVMGQYEPRDRITVHYWRADQEHSVRIRLASHPEDQTRAYLGIYFQTISTPELDLPGG